MDGLCFQCQPGCTNCCRTHGYVYITEQDLIRIAEYLGMTPAQFEAKHVYRTRHQLRLRKPRHKQCQFLLDTGCSIHAVKPTQCRLYPFWPELLEYRDIWDYEGKKCPGINQGPLIQIGEAMEIASEMKKAYPFTYS
jgi:Fe-S-cluster containining protein